MATAVFAETSDKSQYSTPLIAESRSYTLNTSCWILRTKNQRTLNNTEAILARWFWRYEYRWTGAIWALSHCCSENIIYFCAWCAGRGVTCWLQAPCHATVPLSLTGVSRRVRGSFSLAAQALWLFVAFSTCILLTGYFYRPQVVLRVHRHYLFKSRFAFSSRWELNYKYYCRKALLPNSGLESQYNNKDIVGALYCSTVSYVMWREERPRNVSVLQRVHFFEL
jgi:hypothetical protein